MREGAKERGWRGGRTRVEKRGSEEEGERKEGEEVERRE